jgi:hypothetical protein
MKSRSRTRHWQWLLAAMFAMSLAQMGYAADNPPPQQPPPNHCVYCYKVLFWVVCITTTQPIPGGDISACRR